MSAGTPVTWRPAGGRHALEENSGIARLRLVALPLLATLLGAVAGAALSLAGGQQWEAQSTVVYTPPSQDPVVFPGANPASGERELADVAALAVSETVLDPAAGRLGTGEDWTDLQDAVTVTPSPGSGVITVSVTGPGEAETAARLAAVTTAFSEVTRQRAVDAANAAAAAAQDLAASGSAAAEEVRVRAAVLARTAEPVQVLSTAPPTRTGPAVPRDAATGAVLGLLLAAAWLALRSVWPTRVSSVRDAAEVLDLPVGQIRAGQVVPWSEQLVDDLLCLGGPGTAHRIVVVPAGAASAAAAQEVAAVLRDTIPALPWEEQYVAVTNGAPAVQVEPATLQVHVTDDPATAVIAPLLRGATAVVLAVERGAPLRQIRGVQRLSRQWERPPDAVVVTG